MERQATVGDRMSGEADTVQRVHGSLSALQNAVGAVLKPRLLDMPLGVPPDVGERATGYGVSGIVAAVPCQQPLAADSIWRVVLAEEAFGRLVGRRADGTWKLLSLNDLTDAQLNAFEAVLGDPANRDAPTPEG